MKLINNAIFGKNMENVRKDRDINLVIAERRRNYLVSQPNYHTRKFFHRTSISNRNEKKKKKKRRKTETLMNKPVYFILY